MGQALIQPGNLEPLLQSQGLSSAPFALLGALPASPTLAAAPASCHFLQQRRHVYGGVAKMMLLERSRVNGNGNTPTSGRSSYERTSSA